MNGLKLDSETDIGMPNLNSLGVLKSISTGDINRADIIGLLVGAAGGWFLANKWPNMIIKYVGIVVGAELGIIVARLIKGIQSNK